jgi:hypothetical protein
MPVKTDRKDARGIAQLMRLGWFRPVHCKLLPAQKVRALSAARKLLQTKNHDVEMSLRGVLRGFGLKVGPTTPRTFPNWLRELVDGHATLSIAEAVNQRAKGHPGSPCKKNPFAAAARVVQVANRRALRAAKCPHERGRSACLPTWPTRWMGRPGLIAAEAADSDEVAGQSEMISPGVTR